MAPAWYYILAGFGFCIAGIILFQLSVFEENKKILMPLLVILAGIILVSIGMALKLGLLQVAIL
ncbi:MAG: hypothetical protein NTW29_16355 [Bacteroidetes bacterium]|nr:hypothetical protein [Bacteroidota bacterium]